MPGLQPAWALSPPQELWQVYCFVDVRRPERDAQRA
jgi:hypothetical protein